MELEVEADNWILPNRIGYNKKIYETFNPNKYPIKKENINSCKCDKDVCDLDTNTIKLFPQQRIIRDYIQINSPYRGILLYHELGSGKSAASIAAAEGYVRQNRKIFVLTPASLSQNYENELMKMSELGLNMKKSWTLLKLKPKKERTKETIEKLKDYAINENIIKADNNVWIPLYKDDIPDSFVIKSNILFKSLDNDEKKSINETIIHIIKNRYTFISYNGLTQKLITSLGKLPFNDSFIIIDEIHNFISRVVNGSKLARNIYNSIMSASNCKIVLLSGTPIINNPYEIASLINLIRGPMYIYNTSILKSSLKTLTLSVKEINDIITDNLKKNDLIKYIDEISYNNTDNILSYNIFPTNFVNENLNNLTEIVRKDWKFTESKLIEKIQSSLKTIKEFKFSAKSTQNFFYALPNKKEDFYNYFIDETDPENPFIKNQDLFERRILGTLSYYKTTGTELFPTILPINIQYLDMTDHQFNVYSDIRKKEIDFDNNKKKFNKGKDQKNLFGSTSSVYRAFSRMICNFAFPEEIKRIFPQDIRKSIKKEMDIVKEDDLTDSDEEEDDEEDKIKKNIKEQNLLKKKEKKDVANKYELELNNAMIKLVKDNYLTFDNLQKLYSPKFAKMLIDVKSSPGSVLIYSQFRNIEGLGIFSEILNIDGFKEIKIKKEEGDYIIEDLSVFDDIYNYKRYVVFSSDRTKTNILMNIFNGAYSLLPDNILKQLKTVLKTDESMNQLYGKIVKIMMITQSGAEGISLKNVRSVLITEYFWNSVRINQVIGRAVRTCSHELLPKADQNVSIFIYIMQFTKKQLDKNFTLRTVDKGKSTDQYILDIASKKENIINQFLNMLKIASMDCIINSVQNKPLKNGYKCYNWAINTNLKELSYTDNINNDSKILAHKKFQVSKTNKGKVISKDGIKYVLLNDKVYDYFSYKNAGILLEVFT